MRPVPHPRPLPAWLATLLVQAGSFLLALGTGVVVIAFVYGGQSFGVGLALLAAGYAAVSLPRWWLARLPRYRHRGRRLLDRLRPGDEMDPQPDP